MRVSGAVLVIPGTLHQEWHIATDQVAGTDDWSNRHIDLYTPRGPVRSHRPAEWSLLAATLLRLLTGSATSGLRELGRHATRQVDADLVHSTPRRCRAVVDQRDLAAMGSSAANGHMALTGWVSLLVAGRGDLTAVLPGTDGQWHRRGRAGANRSARVGLERTGGDAQRLPVMADRRLALARALLLALALGVPFAALAFLGFGLRQAEPCGDHAEGTAGHQANDRAAGAVAFGK